jgi:hypothetical protein
MPGGQPANGRNHKPSMPLSGRPDEMTHCVGTGCGVFALRKEVAELAVLGQAGGELVAARRVVKELERARAGRAN